MADVARSYGGGNDPPEGDDPWAPTRGYCEGDKKRRGTSKNKKVKAAKRANDGQPIEIELVPGPKGNFVAAGENAKQFGTVVGSSLKGIPLYYDKWTDVPEHLRMNILNEIELFFNMRPHLEGPHGQQVFDWILHKAGKIYRDKKNKFYKKFYNPNGDNSRVPHGCNLDLPEWRKYVDFVEGESFQKRSAANKANKASQTKKIHTGRKSFAARAIQTQPDGRSILGSLIENYRTNNINPITGQFYYDESENAYNEMRARLAAQEGEPTQLTEDEIITQVLGERYGWERGVGPRISRSASCGHSRPSQSQSRDEAIEKRITEKLTKKFTRGVSKFVKNLLSSGSSSGKGKGKIVLELDSDEDDEEEEEEEERDEDDDE